MLHPSLVSERPFTVERARALLNGGRAAAPRSAYGFQQPTHPTQSGLAATALANTSFLGGQRIGQPAFARSSSPTLGTAMVPARSVFQHCPGGAYANCGDEIRHSAHNWFDLTF